MDTEAVIRAKYRALEAGLSEAVRRRWAATETRALGRGGPACVSRATGFSLPTIRKGIREVEAWSELAPKRQRRLGGGRKPLTKLDRGLTKDLQRLVAPSTRGSPTSPLRWTCKSTYRLAEELCARGHPVSPRTVSALLHGMGYSLQPNRKVHEGGQQPDRDAQFAYISEEVERFQSCGQPVISVDTKKKELVGLFRQGGREWQPTTTPQGVRVYDFIDDAEGKAIPYGVYDLGANSG